MSSLMFILERKCKSVVKQTGFTEMLIHNDIVNSFALLVIAAAIIGGRDGKKLVIRKCCQDVGGASGVGWSFGWGPSGW